MTSTTPVWQLDPHTASCLEKAEYYIESGQNTKAVEWFDQAFTDDPSPALLMKLGEFLWQIGSLKEAEQIYHSLIAKAHQLGDLEMLSLANTNLAIVHRDSGDAHAAFARNQLAISLSQKRKHLESASEKHFESQTVEWFHRANDAILQNDLGFAKHLLFLILQHVGIEEESSEKADVFATLGVDCGSGRRFQHCTSVALASVQGSSCSQ